MKKHVFILMLALICIGCDGNSAMRNMSNIELVAKRDECLRSNPTAPGRVTACENLRKECERRREEGNYAC